MVPGRTGRSYSHARCSGGAMWVDVARRSNNHKAEIANGTRVASYLLVLGARVDAALASNPIALTTTAGPGGCPPAPKTDCTVPMASVGRRCTCNYVWRETESSCEDPVDVALHCK